jgi:tryptophan 2,3-dioxygenase
MGTLPPTMDQPRATTYWNYIRVEELLGLQGGIEDDEGDLSNDEVLFITVHQIFELWFKLVLRELRFARDLFTAPRVAEQELSGAVRSLARVVTILQRASQHFEVVETLTTRDYLEFRDKLMPASGFQSAQMRQMEILLGLEEAERIPYGPVQDYRVALREPGGQPSAALLRVEAALADKPTLKEALEDWLHRTPIDGMQPHHPDAEEELARFVKRFLRAHASQVDAARDRAVALAPDEARHLEGLYEREKVSVQEFLSAGPTPADLRRRRIRAAMLFIETYRELPLLSWPREVLEHLVRLEQAFVVFRQRHARMVERVIGRRTGTGGSAGVEYLDQTALKYRVFRDLWAIRTLQIRRDAAPELTRPDYYAFRHGD